MCQCTPNIRTPFCGKPGCEWPEPEKTVPWTDERVERHTEAARGPHVMVHRDFMDAMNERMENLKAENRGLRHAAEHNLERIEESKSEMKDLRGELKTLRAAVIVLEQERNEARKVAREQYRIAKQWHTRQWGEENADHAFRKTEEENPWLLKSES